MGIVYVLTNPAMPGLVKIGKTNRSTIDSRMDELYSTGVPCEFKCEIAIEVDDETAVEGILHRAFSKDRFNSEREFFKLDPEDIKPLIARLGKAIPLSHIEFLEQLTGELEKKHGIPRLQRAKTRRHWNFRSGQKDIWYNVGFHHNGSQVRVRLSIYRSDVDFNRRLFDRLVQRRPEIEKAIGEKLEWKRVTERKESMITAYFPGSLDDSKDELEDTSSRLVSTTVKFHKVFSSILKELVSEVEAESS